MNCAEFRQVSAEFALGLLGGTERAAALQHVAGCVECRAHAESLAQTADALLLLGPDAQPPLGFESRVVAAMSGAGGGSPRRRRLRRRLTALGAALALAAGTGLFLDVLDRDADRHPFESARLETASGARVGEVYASSGEDGSWVFMTVDSSRARGQYKCRVRFADGSSVELGPFDVVGGHGAWGAPLTKTTSSVKRIDLLREGDAVVASARF